jgi:hypothetical protein
MQPGWTPLTGKWLLRGLGIFLVVLGFIALACAPIGRGVGVFVGDLDILPLLKALVVVLITTGLLLFLSASSAPLR